MIYLRHCRLQLLKLVAHPACCGPEKVTVNMPALLTVAQLVKENPRAQVYRNCASRSNRQEEQRRCETHTSPGSVLHVPSSIIALQNTAHSAPAQLPMATSKLAIEHFCGTTRKGTWNMATSPITVQTLNENSPLPPPFSDIKYMSPARKLLKAASNSGQSSVVIKQRTQRMRSWDV